MFVRATRLARLLACIAVTLAVSACGTDDGEGGEGVTSDVASLRDAGVVATDSGSPDSATATASSDSGGVADVVLDCSGGPFCPCQERAECDTSPAIRQLRL